MPRRDSWMTKAATFGEMKPTSAASVVSECNARELLYNTFIGLNRWPREGWDGGRVDFSHFLRGIELQSRLTLLNELEGGVTATHPGSVLQFPGSVPSAEDQVCSLLWDCQILSAAATSHFRCSGYFIGHCCLITCEHVN